MRIKSLMAAFDDAKRAHPHPPVVDSFPPLVCEHPDVVRTRKELCDFVDRLLREIQSAKDPADWHYQEAITQLTYFNTKMTMRNL